MYCFWPLSERVITPTPDGKFAVEPFAWYAGQFAKQMPVQLLLPELSALYVYNGLPLESAKYCPRLESVLVVKTALLTAGVLELLWF